MKTRKRIQTSLAVLVTSIGFLVSGCVISGGGGGGGGRDDLTLLYTFGGATCQTAGATRVVVRVVGVGVNDGTTKDELCSGFPEGMTLKDLRVGSYEVTIEGYDSVGLLYQMDSPRLVTVSSGAANRFEIDVPSVLGDLTVYWNSFAGESDCALAGVDEVVASLFDAQGVLLDSSSIPCASGGANWAFIEADAYTVQLDAYGAGAGPLYQGLLDVIVVQGQADTYTVDLVDNTGDLAIYWTFRGSGICGGVASVRVRLLDPSGAVVDDTTFPCADGGELWTGLWQGLWSATLQGMDSSGRILMSATEQTVDVQVGQNNAYTIDLN